MAMKNSEKRAAELAERRAAVEAEKKKLDESMHAKYNFGTPEPVEPEPEPEPEVEAGTAKPAEEEEEKQKQKQVPEPPVAAPTRRPSGLKRTASGSSALPREFTNFMTGWVYPGAKRC